MFGGHSFFGVNESDHFRPERLETRISIQVSVRRSCCSFRCHVGLNVSYADKAGLLSMIPMPNLISLAALNAIQRCVVAYLACANPRMVGRGLLDTNGPLAAETGAINRCSIIRGHRALSASKRAVRLDVGRHRTANKVFGAVIGIRRYCYYTSRSVVRYLFRSSLLYDVRAASNFLGKVIAANARWRAFAVLARIWIARAPKIGCRFAERGPLPSGQ